MCVDDAHTNFHTLDAGFWAFGELLRGGRLRDTSEHVTFRAPVSEGVPPACCHERKLTADRERRAGRWRFES
jgi:hypothetical protein